MNSPVIRHECQEQMRQLEEKINNCMKEDRAEFTLALAKVESWIFRLEDKISKTNDSIVETNKTMSTISKEVAVGLFFAIIYIFGGKT
jgi:hypothetical protein